MITLYVFLFFTVLADPLAAAVATLFANVVDDEGPDSNFADSLDPVSSAFVRFSDRVSVGFAAFPDSTFSMAFLNASKFFSGALNGKTRLSVP